MTEKQKKDFLKAEGWSQRRDSEFGDLIWVDPKGESERWNTPTAFAVASRRKRQREARKLKAAGWRPCYRCGLHKARWTNNKAVALGNCYPKSEALQTLEAQP